MEVALLKIFVKIGRWIITLLILIIAIPFFPSIPSIVMLLIAAAVVPTKKMEEIRARLFKKKKKTVSEVKLDPAGEFVNIGLWDIPSNEFLNTAARYERGLQIEPERIWELNKKQYSARIMGSEGYAYEVTLAGCECMDYQRRGLPCKHMLRLAKELGEEIALPVFDPQANSEYDPGEDIALLTERWKAGKITTEAYSKCIKALHASTDKRVN